MANEIETEYWKHHRYRRSDVYRAFDEAGEQLFLLLLHIDEKGELHPYSKANLSALYVEQMMKLFKMLYLPGEVTNRSFLVSCADAYSGSPPAAALGRVPVFATSKFRWNTSVPLIPDPEYLVNEGYMKAWETLSAFNTFAAKTPVLYWRGRTTGSELTAENWRSNPRVRLALKSKEAADPSLDAYLVEVVQFADESVKKAISDEGLLRPFADPGEFAHYRYLLDIDGNASAWSCFSKLGFQALLFKVEGDYKQWFSDYLKPWIHYIPVSPDLSDLVDLLYWAKDHPQPSATIAEQCNKLAWELNYEAVIQEMRKLFREFLSFEESL